MNWKQYDKQRAEMVGALRAQIGLAAEQCGSREALSLRLGHAENHVRQIVRRAEANGGIEALERLARECEKILKK